MRKGKKEEGMVLGNGEGRKGREKETKIKKMHRKACGRRKRRNELRRETKKTGQEDT
jgi:hypothetical protein